MEDQGQFRLKVEEMCYQYMTPCSSYDHVVECPNKDMMGLALVDSAEYSKYAINNIESVM